MQSEQLYTKQNVYYEWGRLASLSLKSIFGYEERENYTGDPSTYAFQCTDNLCPQNTSLLSFISGSQTYQCIEWCKELFKITAFRASSQNEWESVGEKSKESDFTPTPSHFDTQPGLRITGLEESSYICSDIQKG